ncbi:P-loop containing nucleoside triphosphate hydrolase protein [Mycena polygramma]|nr:P-loop containing nucleoside triphosphate hydrolase protein [Mycena polygramma]
MVGRKKASSSTAKSTGKQTTILDLFSKKSAPVAVPPQVIPPAVSQLAPQQHTFAADVVQTPVAPNSHNISQTSAPVASTSKAAELIDITDVDSSPTPPPKPLSTKEPTPPRSPQPSSSGPQRPPDPIVIDSHPMVIDLTLHVDSPLAEPKASKPTYSIFAPRPKIDGHVPSAPVLQNPQPTYSIFSVKPKKPSRAASPIISSVSSRDSDAPFPAADSQHVRGPQTVFSTVTYPKRASEKGIHEPMEPFRAAQHEHADCNPQTLTRQPASSFWEKEQCIESIPLEHKRDHPAIARLTAAITSPPDASSPSEKLWSDRWRPQRADGVLGNEANTLYLRDWLRTLEVRFEAPASLDGGGKGKGREEARGAKRPKVMRSVTRAKKRRRQASEDGFIVTDASDYSSDVEGPVDIEGEDDDDFRPAEMEASLGEGPSSSFRDQHLANTIILSGPSGTGKTTAVYSCAEELGWEVFEVYPGIGKRNGASLETLIGEVGKNHLVRRTHAKGVFNRGRDEEAEPDNSTDFGFATPKLKAGARQSVILLEEVDILFKEDANFWPAVIRLIRDCKRAVICTCNDISLVPTSELPLQTILEFQPCLPDVAGSYLQGICCAEGYIVSRDTLSRMYAKGGCDLRHIIHRLQLLCQGFPLGSLPERDYLLDWSVASRQSVPHADLISFTDAYMTRGSLDRPGALALTRYVPSADDELGFPVLGDALNDGYGTYEWDTKIIAAVIGLSRGTRVAHVDSGTGEDYQELIDALGNNLAFPVGLMERAAVHTEYVPWARMIIAGEDAQEARQERQGRGTRNSVRYIRSIEVGSREREALEASSLRDVN